MQLGIEVPKIGLRWSPAQYIYPQWAGFYDFEGKIISISPATGSSFSLLPPDNATGNYVKIVQRVPVRIELIGENDDEDLLKSGMNVNVYVPKKQNNATK